ncbi:MAG: ImmA/IrrE family metallo-endopeptidase [Actinomycetales bacterium]
MNTIETSAREAAARFRADNDLGIAPIADVVALIAQAQDVDVTVLDVADTDEHGLTMVDPERGATVVAVACSENPMRWRSTLAHELGHLIFEDHNLGDPGRLAANTPVEERARAFARHLLLPMEAVERFVAHAGIRDLSALSDLAQRFQVSPAIAAIQLRDAGHIDDARFEEWQRLYTPTLASRFGWTDQYRALQGESRQRRPPQRLLARAVSGYLAGVVSIETLASIRGVSVEVLTVEFDEAGIVPPEHPQPMGTAPDVDLDDAGEFVDLSWFDDE